MIEEIGREEYKGETLINVGMTPLSISPYRL